MAPQPSGLIPLKKPKKKSRPNRKSKQSVINRNRKNGEKLIKKAIVHRMDEHLRRFDNPNYRCIEPRVFQANSCKGSQYSMVSLDTTEFYEKHHDKNTWVRVSQPGEINVSNKGGDHNGGKGLFAIKDIPSGTRICPFVGNMHRKPCDGGCKYDLKLGKDMYLCARECPNDLAYLARGDFQDTPALRTRAVPSPPNYARYCNSLPNTTLADKDLFNCAFEVVGDGLNAMFLETTRDVVAGEEMLVWYGESFQF
jgi:hypothetical protein